MRKNFKEIKNNRVPILWKLKPIVIFFFFAIAFLFLIKTLATIVEMHDNWKQINYLLAISNIVGVILLGMFTFVFVIVGIHLCKSEDLETFRNEMKDISILETIILFLCGSIAIFNFLISDIPPNNTNNQQIKKYDVALDVGKLYEPMEIDTNENYFVSY